MLESRDAVFNFLKTSELDIACPDSRNSKTSMNKAAETDVTETTLSNPSAELEAIRLHPEEAMTRIYREHRAVFIRWARSWSRLSDPDLADVFQDCCIILLKNIRTGRLSVLTASVQTYLFGICKKLLTAEQRRSRRITFPGEENLQPLESLDLGAEHRTIANEDITHIENALARLGEPCHRLLRLTFYERWRSAKIADEMGYASADVVRTQRGRCLDKLRALFKPN